MARQPHWINRGSGGECVFLTTTALAFVRASTLPHFAIHDSLLTIHKKVPNFNAKWLTKCLFRPL